MYLLIKNDIVYKDISELYKFYLNCRLEKSIY